MGVLIHIQANRSLYDFLFVFEGYFLIIAMGHVVPTNMSLVNWISTLVQFVHDILHSYSM